MGLFSSIIEEMLRSDQFASDPVAFKTYADSQGFKGRTAEKISVDEFGRLDPDLKKAAMMVLRLGSSATEKGTQFALARSNETFSDYFLFDDQVFKNLDPTLYLPSAHARNVLPYKLLPRLTETSLVNLACASGLMASALRLDDLDWQPIPATGQSTFSFQFTPHVDSGKSWLHNQGQVEIDAIFVGRREGVESLFVVEAKASSELRSLAKHKLVYPILAIAEHVPVSMPIVPVYLRCIRQQGKTIFFIAECTFDDPRLSNVAALNRLEASVASATVLHL